MGATTNARITKLEVDDVPSLGDKELGELAGLELRDDGVGNDVIEAARRELEHRGRVIYRPGFIARLAEAMAEAGEVTKSSRNTEQNYSYASAEAILAAVRRPLLDRGIILKAQPRDYTETSIQSRSGTAGTRVVIAFDFTFLADDGELLVEGWRGEGQDYGDKAYAKAKTAALKTFIRAEWLLPTDTGDDPEGSSPGERVAAGADAELPPWAKASSRARVEELVAALEPIIGRGRGVGLATSIRDSLGLVPDVAVGTAKAIATAVLEELDPLALADAQDRRAKREAEAAEKAKAEEAQAAAEAPDTPGPSGEEPDAPADVDAGPPDEPAEDLPVEEPPADVGQDDPDRLPAGTVPEPELTDEVLGDVGAAVNRLREAGCTCPQPLVVYKSNHGGPKAPPASRDDACPLFNHGIPF